MITEFVDHLVTNKGYSAGTAKEYKESLHEFATWAHTRRGDAKWSNIRKVEIQTWVHEMSMTGFKPATIKRKVSALRSYYSWLRYLELMSTNPAQFVQTPKLVETVPTTIEDNAIRAAVYDSSVSIKIRGIIAIMAETGIRIGEALHLRWGDINAQAQTIVVYGKGKKERTVYYGNWTAAYISKYEDTADKVIFNYDDRAARYEIHKAIAKHTESHRGSSHQLRHTFASEMLNNGCPIETIGNLLGHKSVKTTERYAKCGTRETQSRYIKYKPNYN